MLFRSKGVNKDSPIVQYLVGVAGVRRKRQCVLCSACGLSTESDSVQMTDLDGAVGYLYMSHEMSRIVRNYMHAQL